MSVRGSGGPGIDDRDDEVRAILFDLDGVLVDSLDAWAGVVNEVRRDLGYATLSESEVLSYFGQGVEDDVKNLYPGRSADDIRRRYDEAMPRHVGRMRLGRGVFEVLARLRARGLKTAVVTNTQATLAREILARTGLEGRVDALAAAGEGLPEKPRPDLLFSALARLGVGPGAARMVGDTDYDATAARAAGVPYLYFDVRKGGDLAARLAPWVV